MKHLYRPIHATIANVRRSVWILEARAQTFLVHICRKNMNSVQGIEGDVCAIVLVVVLYRLSNGWIHFHIVSACVYPNERIFQVFWVRDLSLIHI